MEIMHNTGFLEAPPRETDWIAGESSLIEFKQMNHMGDWTTLLPSNERQNSVYMDSMACVTFSALNCLESQIRGHIAYQRLPQKTIKALKDLGYFNDRLEFNLSDRFTAKMSGTTRQGNYFVNVWDSIRKHGVLPEADWPYPRDQRTPAFDWDDYYKEIPQELKDKALKFLDLFEVKYEWVIPTLHDISYHLYQAPIQIAAPTCTGWNTARPVEACTMKANHATMVYGIYRAYKEKSEYIRDFDSYDPYRKDLVVNYPISYAIKGVLIPKI